MKYVIRKKIIDLLMPAKKEGLTEGKLLTLLGSTKKDRKRYTGVLDALEKDGIIYFSKGRYVLKGAKHYFEGTVVKLSRSHGFIRNDKTEEELFVRGKDFQGAVPGDRVLARVIEFKDETHNSDTASVVLVLEETEGVLTGTIVTEGKNLKLRPDSFVSDPLTIVRYNGNDIKDGDKVKFSIHKRASHHSDITVNIESIYGSSGYAKVSVDAYIDEKAILTDFPSEVIDEAIAIERKGISSSDYNGREDLRSIPIFTIDGADTKDIDDAISIERKGKGFSLGVHIADVSHYVKKGSELEKEVHRRGTSIYIADRVIPMLPKQLSNGICSLNPNTDRLAFSCLMELNEKGEIKKYRFVKSVIRSRVQGVYSEINSILAGEETPEIKEKYAEVMEAIPLMAELSAILDKNRDSRGAPEIDSKESKIICNEEGICVDIKERTRGISEGIIENFMLCANNCAAKTAMDKGFPFVYRVHESPDKEKLLRLQQTLVNLGEDPKGISEKSTAADLSALLKRTKESPKAPVINKLTLRSMMKAKYSEEPIGHFGLVMAEYAHFTSPIRRYADFTIHRVLTEYVSGTPVEKLTKKFHKLCRENAHRASITELIAVEAERDCEKFYMAEYMRNHVGEEFDGFISGVIGTGFFVELPNTVEGKVDVLSLPLGSYEVMNDISLVETLSNKAYTIGEPVRVKCVKADAGSGLIDFILV